MMTPGCWLLLLLVVSSQSVDSQSTTDTCSDAGLAPVVDKLQKDVERINYSLQQIVQILQQQQTNGPGSDKPHDCFEIYKSGERSDGVYTVYIGRTSRLVEVYCDMTTLGGGWTVFQRRKDGSVDFYRTWYEYRVGFGNVTGEFWLGNDNIHELTSGKNYVLRVDLADFERNSRYAEYSNFNLGSAAEKYTLNSFGTYSGNAGDALSNQLGYNFSTRVEDNDAWPAGSCSERHSGGWWYGLSTATSGCTYSNLNGLYRRDSLGSNGIYLPVETQLLAEIHANENPTVWTVGCIAYIAKTARLRNTSF